MLLKKRNDKLRWQHTAHALLNSQILPELVFLSVISFTDILNYSRIWKHLLLTRVFLLLGGNC